MATTTATTTTTTTTTPTTTTTSISASSSPESSPSLAGAKNNNSPSAPSPPRRSSSLHRAVIARLRPMPFQYIWAAWHTKPQVPQPPPPAVTAAATATVEGEGEGHPHSYSLTQLIDNVPDIAAFYRIFNNIPWTTIRARESIHFFRAGVKPLWEDAENVDGGCLVVKVRKDGGRAVRAWEEICLMACGGQLQASVTQERDHVVGISFSPRLYWVHISIWTKQGGNRRSVELLTQTLLAGLSPDLRPKSSDDYYFKKHSDHQGWADIVEKKMKVATTT